MRKIMLRTVNFLIVTIVAIVLTIGCNNDNKPSNQELKGKSREPELLFSEDFENYNPEIWLQTDTNAWALDSIDGNSYIALKQQSVYEPPHRSPYNIMLADTLKLENFVMTLKAKSTKGDYNHRDLCIFFGYQDPAHYYYIHLGMKADPHAHSIFTVNDSDRVSIASYRTDSLTWGGVWHDIKLVRDAESGKIEVYYDDMENAIMKATDKTFIQGKIGIGSFDDTGYFDEIKIQALN